MDTIVRPLLAGAIGGLIATAPMTVFMLAAHRFLPWFEQYPLPPREITEELAERVGIEENIRLYFEKKLSDEEFENIATAFDRRFPELAQEYCRTSAGMVRAWRKEAAPQEATAAPAAQSRRAGRPHFARYFTILTRPLSAAWRLARGTAGVFGIAGRVFSSTYSRIAAIWTYVPHEQARWILAGFFGASLNSVSVKAARSLLAATLHRPFSRAAGWLSG